MRAYLRIVHRFVILGRDRLPQDAPFVMVANHSSHLDAIALCAPLPLRLRARVFPLAAADTFFQTPRASLFAAHALNALPVFRDSGGKHAFDDLRERLTAEPCGYILFPEGTRTRTGEMTTFKPGLGVLVAGTSVPVIPCHLEGAFAAWPAGQRIPRPRRLRLTIGEALHFEDQPHDLDGWRAVCAATRAQIVRMAGS